MRRAQETAQPLADVAGLDVEVHPGLAEYDAHLPTYVPLEELRADEEAWAAAVAEWMSPEAEERRQAFRRTVVDAVESIAARHAGQRVAVVCHGGVINAYLSHVLSMASTMWFEPAYTSVSRALVGDRTQVVSVNEAPHLPGLLLPSTAR
jgi:probable phosphoglycerate mutase